MSSEQLEPLAAVNTEYHLGKIAFERGEYRQSVHHLTRATALVERNTRLGGEIQIWLVTAYEAAGQRTEALELCRQIRRHPSWETRKQSKRLLYILEAPQLVRRAEWMTEIPDLSKLDEGEIQTFKVSSNATQAPSPEPTKFVPEVVDLSQVKTQDPQFIWFALGILILTLGSLYWFS